MKTFCTNFSLKELETWERIQSDQSFNHSILKPIIKYKKHKILAIINKNDRQRLNFCSHLKMLWKKSKN